MLSLSKNEAQACHAQTLGLQILRLVFFKWANKCVLSFTVNMWHLQAWYPEFHLKLDFSDTVYTVMITTQHLEMCLFQDGCSTCFYRTSELPGFHASSHVLSCLALRFCCTKMWYRHALLLWVSKQSPCKIQDVWRFLTWLVHLLECLINYCISWSFN